jgi:glycosyltransferase involved in cell wall biosynthesis
MRILHVIANLAPRYGGPYKVCNEMAAAMASRGHQVKILTTNQDGPGELNVPLDIAIDRNGVQLRFFPIQTPRFWGFSRPLGKALHQTIPQMDIVHIHSMYLYHDMMAAQYCRQFRIPYLIRPHGTLDPYIYKRRRFRKWLMEWLFQNKAIRGASAIHFTSEEEKILASPHTFNSPGIVVPLGIHTEQYQATPPGTLLSTRYPETKDKKIILFFGRVNFKKGLDILAKAFALVAHKRPDVHLVIAGPDNEGYGTQVKEWLREAGILEKTTFTGLLEGTDKLRVLKESALFVLPSYSENFGISVIEAMSAGVPVIISDKVNIWREIEEAGAGLVGPCDSSRFAEMILKLLQNPPLALQMSEKAKDLVKERFEWDRVAVMLERAYESILGINSLKNERSASGAQRS